MGKATGIIASVGLTLGSMLASHLMSDSPAPADAKPQVPAPWNVTSLNDLQRVRNQSNQQMVNPATGKLDAYGTVQAWVEQTEAAEHK